MFTIHKKVLGRCRLISTAPFYTVRPNARGPWAASGPEELRDSEWSHGCRRDAVTIRFQYLVPQVTVSDDDSVSQTWVARPELDINLNPGDPSH